MMIFTETDDSLNQLTNKNNYALTIVKKAMSVQKDMELEIN